MTHHTVRWRLAAVALLSFSFTATAQDGTQLGVGWTEPLSWSPCPAGSLPDAIGTYLADRLECGRMVAPVANAGETTGMHAEFMNVGLVRVKAGTPSERLGTLFFNVGGPGGNPALALPHMVYVWSTSDQQSHPGMRQLADRYDVVAVIPRGVKGSDELSCPAFTRPDPRIGADDAGQWQLTEDAYATLAAACRDWRRQFMGTMNHVVDMEQARRLLGEPVLNFLGTSYGTWVGAAYAATYPEHTGRMVLDSAMDYSGTFEAQLEAASVQQQADFNQYIAHPLASDPRYGFNSDENAIVARLRQMPLAALSDLAPLMAKPEDFVAALALVDISPNGDMAPDDLRTRLAEHRFSADRALDDKIRSAALAMASDAFSSFPAPEPSGIDRLLAELVNTSVYETVVCGDTPWRATSSDLRGKAMTHAFLYPAAAPANIGMGLTCRSWPFPRKERPSLKRLEKAPPVFIVQAEFDPATPLALAAKAFAASPGAYMMVAQGVRAHGILIGLDAPCIEEAASRYLLTGQLPATRFQACASEARRPRSLDNPVLQNPVADDALRRLRAAFRQL